MAEIYINMEIIVVLKKIEKKDGIYFVFDKCLGQIGIENVCFHVEILRLSWICGLKVYILMGGWLSQLYIYIYIYMYVLI